MNQFVTIAATAIISAFIASWGTTVIMADAGRKAAVAPASASMDVMQMMRDAKDLREERYDAY